MVPATSRYSWSHRCWPNESTSSTRKPIQRRARKGSRTARGVTACSSGKSISRDRHSWAWRSRAMVSVLLLVSRPPLLTLLRIEPRSMTQSWQGRIEHGLFCEAFATLNVGVRVTITCHDLCNNRVDSTTHRAQVDDRLKLRCLVRVVIDCDRTARQRVERTVTHQVSVLILQSLTILADFLLEFAIHLPTPRICHTQDTL